MTIKPPEENNTDKALNVIKAAIEEIPGGSVATSILSAFLTLPYQKRLNEWQQQVSDTLEQLQNSKGIELEDLKNNQEFIDILLQAFQIGMRNHQTDKREALKNAITNSASNKTPDFAMQQIFLNYIDTFTEWHIKILILMVNPRAWFGTHSHSLPGMGGMGTVEGTIKKAYPELAKQPNLLNLVWMDLCNRQLVSGNADTLVAGMTPDGALAKRTTDLGEQFIRFISS